MDVEALQKALEGDNSKYSGVLKVEPLPNFFFAGSPTKVIELSTGKEYKVHADTQDSEGLSVTVKRGKKYFNLEKGQFIVTEVLGWYPKTDKLKPTKI
jgi:hypothetical protein